MTRYLVSFYLTTSLVALAGCADPLSSVGRSPDAKKAEHHSDVETVALRHPEVMPLKNTAAAELPETKQTGGNLDVTLPEYDSKAARENGEPQYPGTNHAEEAHAEEGHAEEPAFQPPSRPVRGPNTRPVSSGSTASGSTKVAVRLRTPTALPQTLPSGTAIGFSVDYVFESGEPSYQSEYAWIITNGRGEKVMIPVELKREGVLQHFVSWRPRDKPFKSVLAEKPASGPPREISRTVDMVLVGGH